MFIFIQEASSGSAELKFSREAVELVLQYIYSGKEDIVNPDTVPELYYAANFFGIAPLVSLCESYLKSGMRVDISLEIWQYAKLFEKNEIAEIARSIALTNFESFQNPMSIGRVSLNTITDILADPYLNCSGHEKCKVAWIWFLSHDCVTKDESNTLIRSLVKSSNVETDDILQACEVNQDLATGVCGFGVELEEERKAMWSSATNNQWIQPGQKPNKIVARIMAENETSEWILILGGSATDESKMTLFNFKEKKWFYIEADKVDLGHRYAISAVGSLLYLSGGADNRQTQFKFFDIGHKTWQTMQDLPVGREQHCMVTVVNDMFILGGNSSKSTTVGDIFRWRTTHHWEQHGHLAYPVTNATSAVVGSNVYLVGGSLISNGKPVRNGTDMVQCFETGTRVSYKLRLPLPFKAKVRDTGVAAADGHIYVYHKGNIYQVDESSKPFNLCSISECPVKGFGTVAFGDRVLVFGGENDNFMGFNYVLQYDPTTNKYVKLPMKIPFQMSDFHWTKIRVPLSWEEAKKHK